MIKVIHHFAIGAGLAPDFGPTGLRAGRPSSGQAPLGGARARSAYYT